MTDDRIGEIWRLPENYCKPLAFGRAIEAECRVPDGWQLVPMEPTAEQMEAVINRYCHYNDAVRDEYRTYNIERLRHDYIAAVAAAPKPDPERKHETVPTLAEPDCECGAVASEHCPACEPVAQEPAEWECFEDTSYYNMWAVRPVGEMQWGKCFHLANNAEAETLCAVLNMQPDQSAELATANAVIESERTIYRGRIAELEVTIEAQRTLYANCIKMRW